jgi:unsaturated rhamnogalacturonyl hydrolase
MIFTRILFPTLFIVTCYAQESTIQDNPITISALSSKMETAEILKAMETVADWQLSNPIRIDVIYKTDENKPNERVKILWDGTLLLKENREYEVNEGKYPNSWQRFINLIENDVSFCELPEAVQLTIKETCKIDPSQIVNIQMADKSSKGWEMAAFYIGLMALSNISSEPYYFEALKAIGETNNWKLGDRIYHADDHCVGQMYLDMYTRYNEKEMLADIKMKFDWIIDEPHEQGIEYKQSKNRWTWSDALFMSPPVWVKLSAITEDRKYIDYMDREWWLVTDHLFDTDEHLFFRDERYFELRGENGKKIFWSRGNGWVIAGLARVLENMPEDYPTRNRYVKLFQQMAKKLTEIQPEDGLWGTSLLDPIHYPSPEASGSGFICYALAWGINNGLLKEEVYLPVIKKTWEGLIRCIQPDDKLGWVQLPGGGPDEVTGAQTASYGVGAFLLAGSELSKLVRNIHVTY